MGAFSSDFSCLDGMLQDISDIGKTVRQNEQRVVKLAGQEYANDVKQTAPYKTGTYRRSIHVEIKNESAHEVALVGTDVPYGRRLEYGFADTDKLGRVYHQRPQPHWRPAWNHNLPKYERILKSVFDRQEWNEDVATFEGVRPDLAARI